MRSKLLLTIMCLFLSGCWLFRSGPTGTVKTFMTYCEKGNVEQMTNLFSAAALQKVGRDKIVSNNKSFADLVGKAIASGENLQMDTIKETFTRNTAKVSFFYRDLKRGDSIALVFKLVRENNQWKVDEIGGPELK